MTESQTQISTSNLKRQIILGNDNINKLASLYVFPKIIINIQQFLNIKSAFHIPSLTLNKKSRILLKLKKDYEMNMLKKYMSIVQNTPSYFSILSYLNFYPVSYGFRPFIFNPITCAFCPKILKYDKNMINGEKNEIFCSYECFLEKIDKDKNNSNIFLKRKTKRSKNISKSYKRKLYDETYTTSYTLDQIKNINNNFNLC